ncbi:hypothetical protein [Cellulophaga baltica]|uniref:Uncharacterized protein n=1 Tax=Cellulophaga baltica 18 TaxID=1348584 RepID=A0AAU8RVB6_9FLAO|nr:hypothetical protein [Cellulophaga baltica]AIZ42692.1 hypothetical protein M666_14590 [Cellulophaga baltica 18]
MKSRNNLNDKIRLTTIKIQEEYPELVKYIDEIPREPIFVSDEEVSSVALKAYLDSLNEILNNYSQNTKLQDNENK